MLRARRRVGLIPRCVAKWRLRDTPLGHAPKAARAVRVPLAACVARPCANALARPLLPLPPPPPLPLLPSLPPLPRLLPLLPPPPPRWGGHVWGGGW